VQTAIYVAHQAVDDFNGVRGVSRQGTAQSTTKFCGIECRPHRAVGQALKVTGGMCLRTLQDIVLSHSLASQSRSTHHCMDEERQQ
jgi:hypothetical protein